MRQQAEVLSSQLAVIAAPSNAHVQAAHIRSNLPGGNKPEGGRTFPPQVLRAIRDTPMEPGLHNCAAMLQRASPEFAGLPMTSLGVPHLSGMSVEQRQEFLCLLQRRPHP